MACDAATEIVNDPATASLARNLGWKVAATELWRTTSIHRKSKGKRVPQKASWVIIFNNIILLIKS